MHLVAIGLAALALAANALAVYLTHHALAAVRRIESDLDYIWQFLPDDGPDEPQEAEPDLPADVINLRGRRKAA